MGILEELRHKRETKNIEKHYAKQGRRIYREQLADRLEKENPEIQKEKAKKRIKYLKEQPDKKIKAKEEKARKRKAFLEKTRASMIKERKAYIRRAAKKAPSVKKVIEEELVGFTGYEQPRRLKEPTVRRRDYDPELANKWGLLPPQDSFIDFGLPKTRARKTKDGYWVGGIWDDEA